ncbi:MAG: RNB domain-containing ribonuclease [Desulfovibrio sp.]|nr:RNB domain-containing ribonuclease [Desulfovibrio sp.]
MSDRVRYPAPGCVVEYMEGNAVQIALVTEEAGGKLRLLLPNRRETRLNASRLLPWLGPLHSADLGREEAVRLLAEHKAERERLAAAVPLAEVWEMAQGEVASAPADWFAELFVSEPTVDQTAAYGRALLGCKSHFRFQPPDFQVFPADVVEKRLAEEKARQAREALMAGGSAFLRLLWDVALRKRDLPSSESSGEWPSPEVAERLEVVLRARMVDPENQEHETLWRALSKGLPDVPHLPLQLLMAWGKLPPHYNFWLDRADYVPGDTWWKPFADEVASLEYAGRNPATDLPKGPQPCLSIDSATTRDVDDAFHVEVADDGWTVTVVLACPALQWPFGGPLDKAVQHRGTSLYLPEGDCHMLPESLGTQAFSLLAGQVRSALAVRVPVSSRGEAGECELAVVRATLDANLTYEDCQAVLDAQAAGDPLPENAAAPFAEQLALGLALARSRQAARIDAGAVIMDRPDPTVTLTGEGEDVVVHMAPAHQAPDAQMLVAEMMILASAAVADWAARRGCAMLHRVQDVALPREYAGVWTAPADMTRVMRALTPSSLEVQARPHAALGLARYAPVTSPLRRYPDLLNEAQLTHMLQQGRPRWSEQEMEARLMTLSPVLEVVGQVQRFRPRYWKLLYFRQQGDRLWWHGVITEENDAFVTVSLPEQGLFVRGRRRLFDDRAHPGMAVDVRLGKVQPLYNEITILECVAAE